MLTERGDTVTENALMAAALHPGTTVIRNASSNYMVQDLCFYLQKLGVGVEGIGTTTLTVTGRAEIDVDVDYAPSEDPIEAMSLLAAAIVTESEITIKRVPIEFLEIELALLEEMGFHYARSEEYVARNGHTRLVDLTTQPSAAARAARQDPPDAVPRPQHRQPAVLRGDRRGGRRARRCCTTGSTRTARSTSPSSTSSAAQVKLLDPHRVLIEGRRTGPAPRSSARRRCGRPW